MTDPLRDVLAAALHEDAESIESDPADFADCSDKVEHREYADAIIAALAAQGVTLTREPGLDVERLRELSDAATPGPWTKTTFGNASTARAAGVMSSFAYATARHAGVPMTDLTVIDGPDGRYAVGFTGNGPHSPENAALIVAAVNALRAALASEDRP